MLNFLSNWTAHTHTNNGPDSPNGTIAIQSEHDPGTTSNSHFQGAFTKKNLNDTMEEQNIANMLTRKYPSTDAGDVTLKPSNGDMGSSCEEEEMEEEDEVDRKLEKLRTEREMLRTKCKELEDLIFDTRQENDLYKVRMTLTMGTLRSKLESLKEDKQCLEEKCSQLGHQLHSLRANHKSKLDLIASLERELRDDPRMECSFDQTQIRMHESDQMAS